MYGFYPYVDTNVRDNVLEREAPAATLRAVLVQYQRLGSYSIYYVQVTKNKVFSNVVIFLYSSFLYTKEKIVFIQRYLITYTS